jgi:hypothetical protein
MGRYVDNALDKWIFRVRMFNLFTWWPGNKSLLWAGSRQIHLPEKTLGWTRHSPAQERFKGNICFEFRAECARPCDRGVGIRGDRGL